MVLLRKSSRWYLISFLVLNYLIAWPTQAGLFGCGRRAPALPSYGLVVAPDGRPNLAPAIQCAPGELTPRRSNCRLACGRKARIYAEASVVVGGGFLLGDMWFKDVYGDSMLYNPAEGVSWPHVALVAAVTVSYALKLERALPAPGTAVAGATQSGSD